MTIKSKSFEEKGEVIVLDDWMIIISEVYKRNIDAINAPIQTR